MEGNLCFQIQALSANLPRVVSWKKILQVELNEVYHYYLFYLFIYYIKIILLMV